MKNIVKIMIAVSILGSVVSCEKEEAGESYDVNSNAAVVQFNSDNVLALPISPDSNLETSIEVGASNVADVDREVIVNVESESSLDPMTYSISSFIIPAGEFVGTGTITVDSRAFSQSESLVLQITGISGSDDEVFIQDTQRIVLNSFEFCLLDDGVEFTGDYELTYAGTGAFGTRTFSNYDGEVAPPVDDSPVVTVSVGGNPSIRTFSTEYLSELVEDFDVDWNFRLVCDNIIWDRQDSGLACAGLPPFVVDPDNSNQSTYDKSDDSSFTINVIDNPLGGCNAAATAFQLVFTKQ